MNAAKVAIFSTRGAAEYAVEELRAAGYPEDAISIAAANADADFPRNTRLEGVTVGVIVGVALGSVIGAGVVGLILFFAMIGGLTGAYVGSLFQNDEHRFCVAVDGHNLRRSGRNVAGAH